MLSDAAADSRQRFDKTTAGGVSGWTLTDALWSKLNPESPTSELVLSGEAASVLLGARAQATQTTQAAGGQADRFKELLGAYRSQPELTGRHLYWQAVIDSLSGRAVTIVDPKAGGHKRFLLGSPDDLRNGGLLREVGSEAPSTSTNPTDAASPAGAPNTTPTEPSPNVPSDRPAESDPSNRGSSNTESNR
jgi:hypothetical protein